MHNAQRKKEAYDLTASLNLVGKCLSARSRTFHELVLNYDLRKQIRHNSCNFKSGKVSLQQEILFAGRCKLLSNWVELDLVG